VDAPLLDQLPRKTLKFIYPSSREVLLPGAQALVAFLSGIEIKASILPSNVPNTNTHAMHILIGPKR
jgi:hypothetical protein